MRFVNNPFTDKLDVASLTGSGAPPVETVTGNDGIAVGPDVLFNLNLRGNNTQGINVTGNAGTNTLTIAGIDSTTTQKGVLETATNAEAAAQSSSVVALTPSNITSLFSSTSLPSSQGGTGLSSPAAHSLIATNGSSAYSVLGVAGNGQIPIGSIGSNPVLANIASGDSSITITNGPGTIDLSVAGAGSAVTTLTGNSGGAISPVLGNINTVGSGSITVVGAVNTLTAQLTGLTNHNVLIGAGTATITNVAPSATSGVPLISQGAAADPAFGTAVVAGGGTGATSFTTHSLILGQGTSAMTALGAATNGQIPVGSTGADPILATITAGTNTSVTNGSGTITIGASQAVVANNYSVANATPYVAAATDYYITVDTSTVAITIQLPDAPTNYRIFIIKDSAGNASVRNVTVTTVSGIKLLDAAATFVMNTNYQAAQFLYDGFGYQVF